ncbi:ABC transporter substrate-binding protein [Kushneria phyllosphaerae]|uniref:Multiple sugar-binding protein n=1 Tax=Kushneria phyllosphaerae TaxID=2100822 RepID=A0A2R8CIT0_9GAMM|nr:ABC transporter substrate-binding protein [Kushneria phyllosphaerae]SPJ32817.1 Multiple sugar-binding protein [Kushneria phyllosphaerae]
MSKANTPVTRRRVIQTLGAGAGLLLCGLRAPAIAKPRRLIIISDLNAAQAPAFQAIAAEFGRQSGTEVIVNNIAHEANKTAIRNYLVADPPDICFWFSGQRMRQFVGMGLFSDISDLVEHEGIDRALGPLLDTVSIDGRQYGLPVGGLFWGLFYREDVFREHGLTPPETFEDFYRTCYRAKAQGLVPVAMGTKDQWPAAGWFDHLNLRINGLETHMALMEGRVAYSDTIFDPVFEQWRDMIQQDFFLDHGTSYAWQQAAAFLARKKAAMMDLSTFLQSVMPPGQEGELKLIRFPTYDASVGPYEDFSSNSIHIPQRAQQKALAREFLAYFYQPDVLARFLAPIGTVPPRNDMPVPDDPLTKTATGLLRASAGSAQYFDRDTHPAMAWAGLKGFQKFSVYPSQGKEIRQELDRIRTRVTTST